MNYLPGFGLFQEEDTSLRAARWDRRQQVYKRLHPSSSSPCWRSPVVPPSPTCPWQASHKWSPAGQSCRGRRSSCRDRQLLDPLGWFPFQGSASNPQLIPHLWRQQWSVFDRFNYLPFTSSNFLSMMLKPLASTTDNLENSRRSFFGFVSGLTAFPGSISSFSLLGPTGCWRWIWEIRRTSCLAVPELLSSCKENRNYCPKRGSVKNLKFTSATLYALCFTSVPLLHFPVCVVFPPYHLVPPQALYAIVLQCGSENGNIHLLRFQAYATMQPKESFEKICRCINT